VGRISGGKYKGLYSFYGIKGRRKPPRKGMKPPPTNTRLKMVLRHELYAEWCERERSMAPLFKNTFTRLERMIVFCRIAGGMTREGMVDELGISERQVKNTDKKLRELGYGNL